MNWRMHDRLWTVMVLARSSAKGSHLTEIDVLASSEIVARMVAIKMLHHFNPGRAVAGSEVAFAREVVEEGCAA